MYRRNWDTVSLEILWSTTSKAVSHEGADLELDALMNRKPVNGVSDKRSDMRELWDAPMRRAAALPENRLRLRCISCRTIYVDHSTIINPGADQSMHQNRDRMQRE